MNKKCISDPQDRDEEETSHSLNKQFGLQADDKAVYSIAISQFGIAFSYNCILSFMPFYLMQVSQYEREATILWTGFIMGGGAIVAAISATFWGNLTTRVRPKLLFQCGIFCHGVIFFIMGFSESLPFILSLRLIQGALGGVSTIGLILIAGSSPHDKLPRHFGLYQNSLTAGQLVGPPVGAYIVMLFGYHSPFIVAPSVIFFALLFCHKYVENIPVQSKAREKENFFGRGIFWGWWLIMVSTIHLMFLPSILPTILENFQLTEKTAISTAGTIVMIYTASAIMGNYLLIKCANRLGLVRLIIIACLAASLCQYVLYFTDNVYWFTFVRALQTGMIATVTPLAIAFFAGEARGTTMGFLNSGRFVGGALGPIMATFLFVQFGLLTLYLAIVALTLIGLFGFLAARRRQTR
ncbi:MFS transporter [bacterium]|nr:MFS transporter [bacterium]